MSAAEIVKGLEALPESVLEKRPVGRERVANIPLADIQNGAAD